MPSGHLVFVRTDGWWAAPFDLDRLDVTGPALPVLPGLQVGFAGLGQFAIAGDGTLVYVLGSSPDADTARTLVWVDREGQEEPLALPAREYRSLSLSPDGTRAALGLGTTQRDIWVSELARGTLTRLTTDEARDTGPLWSPDGRRVVFGSDRNGQGELFWRLADGSGTAEPVLTESVPTASAGAWSPDGATLFVTALFPGMGRDIGMVSTEGPGTWEPLIQTAANQRSPAISPDGQWLAYSSDETGRGEIYVQRFPELDARRAISLGGGSRPTWSADGREWFYLRSGPGPPDGLMRVTLDVDEGDPPSLIVGTPEQLFPWQYFSGGRPYDVSADGQRFLINTQGADETQPDRRQLHVVLNWVEELKRLVPVP